MSAHSGRLPAYRRSAAVGTSRAASDATLATAGHGAGLDAGAEATKDMLSRLAERMRNGGFPWPATGTDAWTTDDNPNIPSGYTYFGQLVAHDLVQNTSQLPLISEYPGALKRDYRTQRLVLDTIYGGGPSRDPLPFAIAMDGNAERCLFRLGHVRALEPQPFDDDPPPPLRDQPARDIPRARCPHLSDAPSGRVSPDSLIADPRNDQHLVISQMTALFHEFHNIVFKKVRALQDVAGSPLAGPLNFPKREKYQDDIAFGDDQDDMAFLQTRKLLAHVFRGVVVDDFLRRILEPGVFVRYRGATPNYPEPLVPADPSGRVQSEFSHAVFRFGHVMARFSYRINDRLDRNPGLKDLLDRSSANRRDLLPLAANWLVDWSHFFDLGDGKPLNLARRIGPFVSNNPLLTDHIFRTEAGRTGALFYKDFTRGYEAGVRGVDTLIAELPASERNRSDLLKDANLREHEIGRWLTHDNTAGLKPDELRNISQQPPLLLFVLFEAAYTQGGARLGILGSTIIADVIFGALNANRATIEDDPAVPVLANAIFGAAMPTDMPGVIKYVKSQGGLADVVVTA